MDFSPTTEHGLIREMARAFAEAEILPNIAERDREHRADPELLRKMGRAGLLGIGLPARYGGAGADYIALGIACEEMERADSTARVVLSVHNGLHAMTLLQWGTDEQKERWLPSLATGEALGAFGLTEPDAGSDAANMRAVARRDGEDYILNGAKTWISLADYADRFLVITKLETGGHAAFVVERTAPGFSSKAFSGKLGVRAGNTGQIFFDDLRVSARDRVGEEGDGFRVAMSALDHGRYTVAAGAVGIIVACLDASVRYANERTVGGEPIGRKQLVQQMIASMARGRDVGRLLYEKVGWMKNVGQRHTREVSMAKWTNCEAAFDAANKALEIHGAYGFSDEFPIERHFRNSRGAMIYEGTHEIHTIMQGEYALGYREDRPLRRTLPPYEAGPIESAERTLAGVGSV